MRSSWGGAEPASGTGPAERSSWGSSGSGVKIYGSDPHRRRIAQFFAPLPAGRVSGFRPDCSDDLGRRDTRATPSSSPRRSWSGATTADGRYRKFSHRCGCYPEYSSGGARPRPGRRWRCVRGSRGSSLHSTEAADQAAGDPQIALSRRSDEGAASSTRGAVGGARSPRSPRLRPRRGRRPSTGTGAEPCGAPRCAPNEAMRQAAAESTASQPAGSIMTETRRR